MSSNDETPLTTRQSEVLRFTIEYPESPDNILRQPPSVQEIHDYLQETLEPKPDGSPALVSREQTFRAIRFLRGRGFLIDPEVHPQIRGKHRNIVPTELGRKHYKRKLLGKTKGKKKRT